MIIMGKENKRYITNSILSFVIVFIAVLTVLTFVRFLIFEKSMHHSYNHISTSPAGLTPEYDESERCIEKSRIAIDTNNDYILALYADINEMTYYSEESEPASFILEKNGMIKVQEPNYNTKGKRDVLHIGWWGPKGFSRESMDELGRFSSDTIVCKYQKVERLGKGTDKERLEFTGAAYDNQSKKIYKLKLIRRLSDDKKRLDENIEFETFESEQTAGDIRIVKIGELTKNDYQTQRHMPFIVYEPPLREATENDTESDVKGTIGGLSSYSHIDLVEMEKAKKISEDNYNFTALDGSGDIYLIDKESLELSKVKGSLLAPPAELHSYSVKAFDWRNEKEIDEYNMRSKYLGYAGMGVFSHHRNGTMKLATFNEEGKKVRVKETIVFPGPVANYGWFEPLMLGTEMFYGLAFHMSSLFFHDDIATDNIKREMFIMPYSFAARALQGGKDKLVMLTIIITITLINCIFFIYLLKASFIKSGLPGQYFKYWVIMTLVFGPMAYLAYRMSMPRIKQITCPNCGNDRRPDQERCYTCKAGWRFEHLEPVGWKIKTQTDQRSA